MAKCKLTDILLVGTIGGFLMIGGCSEKAPVKTEIIPTTGVFSEADEAFYLRRYDILVEAFKTGQETTKYDTEITFGDELSSRPLPRKDLDPNLKGVLETLKDQSSQNRTASLIVYSDGAVVSESYFGDTNADTLINSKSLAKPLGVVAIGRAIEAGFIESLDQSVADFIVEWQGTDKAAIKIRHVLDMRSGLKAQGNAQGPGDVLNRAYLHPRHDEVIIHEYPLDHPPGTRYDYSNVNSELVSVLIARATGLPYQDWLTKEVMQPMGMAGGKIWLNQVGGLAHSGCCIGLPSETYLKLAVLVLQGGEWEGKSFLPDSFIKEMVTATPQNIHVGMGVYNGKTYAEYRGAANPDVSFGRTYHSEPYVDDDIILFDGNGHQVAFILPKRNMIIMRLGKAPRKGITWDNAYIPNLMARQLDQ